ncbi:MAG TPA: histidinol-phosphate transaminase [Candidatus Acidoferrales bacterium]|nr:histidinol-phosphate transaminase [Candidatus Acidoferrales bacterium]
MKKDIRPLRSLASAPILLAEDRKGKLRLDMNENMLGCSPRAIKALRGLNAEDLAMYPEKGAAIARMAPHFGVHPAEMLLSNGIDDALRLIADAFLETGRSALLVEPTFPMYSFFAGQRDARVRSLRYDSVLRFPLKQTLDALRGGPSVFFLANPNNPTGTLLSTSELKKILDAAKRALVVLDEAYYEFSGVTALPWIRRYKNLIVTRTFSKVTGLAGLRLGCVFGHEELIKILKRAESPFPVSIAAIACAEAALHDRAFIRQSARQIVRNRRYLEDRLRKLGARVAPSATNFVLADFGVKGPDIVRKLAQDEILVRDCERWFGRPGFVRITVGTKAQMKRLLGALERHL